MISTFWIEQDRISGLFDGMVFNPNLDSLQHRSDMVGCSTRFKIQEIHVPHLHPLILSLQLPARTTRSVEHVPALLAEPRFHTMEENCVNRILHNM